MASWLAVKYTIEEITRSTPREELVPFLANFENEKRGEDYWRRRLVFWWDENPSKPPEFPLGWVARQEGRLVGFLAGIAFDYVYQGKVHPALDASTWRVLEEHRSISLPMFMKWHQLRDRHIILDTTPKPKVAAILDRFKYRAERVLHYHFFPLRQPGWSPKAMAFSLTAAVAGRAFPRRPLKLVTLKDTFTVAQEAMRTDRLEKRVTRAYLEWYCSWPEKDFIGCVDENNVLTSYLIFEPDWYGKRRVLGVIDYFTTRPDNGEVLALLGHLHRQPEGPTVKGAFSYLMLKTFEMNFFGRQPLGSVCRQNPGKHHYWLPPHLAEAPKRFVAAEGDYGC